MNTDHVQCYTCELSCNNCGLAPTLEPMPAATLSDVIRGFLLMHRRCEKPPEPSRQVELFDELMRKEAGREIPIICVVCNGPLKDGEDPLTHLDQCRRKARVEHPAANPFAECERLAQTEERSRTYVATVTSFGAGIVESRQYGIDGMSDDPDPETDPPGHDLPALTDRDDPFGQRYPRAHDHIRLQADLAVVLQNHGGSPSLEQLRTYPVGSTAYDEIAHWCRMQLAIMNRKEHPELEVYLPSTPQPMPRALVKLTKKARGARPLSSPSPRQRKRRSGVVA